MRSIKTLSGSRGVGGARSSRRAVIIPNGQDAYTTAGSYSWVAPVGVTSVSIVLVGGGGGDADGDDTDGSGGGGLAYANNYPVTPGTSYTVVVGAIGNQSAGGTSHFINTCILLMRKCV